MDRNLSSLMTQLKPQPDSTATSHQPEEIHSRVSPWVAKILYSVGCYLILPLFFGKIESTGQETFLWLIL